MAPSEPYFHLVKALLNTYLDGQAQEALDVSAMADHILERASIGCHWDCHHSSVTSCIRQPRMHFECVVGAERGHASILNQQEGGVLKYTQGGRQVDMLRR